MADDRRKNIENPAIKAARSHRLNSSEIRDMRFNFEHLSEAARNDISIALVAIKYDSNNCRFIGSLLANDKEFMMKVIKLEAYCYEYASEEVKQDPEVAILAVSKYSCFMKLESFNLSLWNSKEFVVVATTTHSKAFEFASEEFKNDPKIAELAIRKSPDNCRFIGCRLLDDKEFIRMILETFDRAYDIFEYASENVRDNFSIAKLAIEKYSSNCRYIGPINANDRAFIDEILGLKNGKYVFKFASEELRNDKDIALKAMTVDNTNCKYIGPSLRDDKKFVMHVILNVTSQIFEFLSEELRGDLELFHLAMAKNKKNFTFASYEIRDTKSIVMYAIDLDIRLLAFVSLRLKEDEVLVKLVLLSGGSLEHVSKIIRNNEYFVMMAVKSRWENFKFASAEIRNDKVFIIKVIRELNNLRILKFVDRDVINDKYFLSEINDISKIKPNSFVYKLLNVDLQSKIKNKHGYLEKYSVVLFKPAKK
jgi:hypothetical protein